MPQHETDFAYILYTQTNGEVISTREMAIAKLCNDRGRLGWQPFNVDYEKGIVFFTRKVNPDRETIENYG